MERIKTEISEVKVIVTGLVPLQPNILEFVAVGASGFVIKGASCSVFLKTIRVVANGGNVLPPQLTGSLFTQIKNGVGNGKMVSDGRLSQREQTVVALVGGGLGNKEIAHRLHLSTYTVKSHVHNILRKLSLRTRLEIAAFAHSPNSKSKSDTTPETMLGFRYPEELSPFSSRTEIYTSNRH